MKTLSTNKTNLKKQFDLSPAQAAILLRADEHPRNNFERKLGDYETTLEILIERGLFVRTLNLSDDVIELTKQRIADLALTTRDLLPNRWEAALERLKTCADLKQSYGVQVWRLTDAGKKLSEELRKAGYTYDLCRYGL